MRRNLSIMQILRILLVGGIIFYLLPGLVMLIFSIVLFFSFLYFISRLSSVFGAPKETNNTNYQQAQGVTIECEEYRVKKS